MPRPIQLTPVRQAVLEALAAQRGPVEPDDIRLSSLVGGRITSTLHEMRKIGLVTFTESSSAQGRGDHHQGLKRLSITDKGRALLPMQKPKPSEPIMAAFLARPISDAILIKPGEHIFGEKKDRKPRLLPPTEAAVAMGDLDRESYTDDQDRDSYTVDDSVEVIREAFAAVPEPVIDEETHPEFPTPVLDALRARQEKVAAAASLLEEAGLDDEAIRVLDALKLSPSEAEYLAFARACGR